MLARRSTLGLAFCVLTAGVAGAAGIAACSSSSPAAGTPTPSGENDSGNSEPSDAGTGMTGPTSDATMPGPDGGRVTTGPGGDASSPPDAGTSVPADATTAGEAGAMQLCTSLCGAVEQCAVVLDAGPSATCNCQASAFGIFRADYVEDLTPCVSTQIASNCAVVFGDAGTGPAFSTCESMVAAKLDPTPETATFCKNLGLTICANAIPDCVAQVFLYSDPTVTAAANCLSQVPDAAVDGGCNAMAQCLNTAFTP